MGSQRSLHAFGARALLMLLVTPQIIHAQTIYPAPPFEDVAEYATMIGPAEDPADVYYPDPEDLLTEDYDFPVAVFLQGMNVDKQHFSRYARIVASYGFVVVVPNHPRQIARTTVLMPDVSQIDDVAAVMALENDDPDSPLFGAIDAARVVVLGHSAGGAEALGLCAQACRWNEGRPYALVAGAVYAAGWRVTSADGPNIDIPPGNQCTVPTMMVQGTQDGIHRSLQSLDVYRRLATLPKSLVLLQGANHYGIANQNNPPDAPPDRSQPTLAQNQSIETIGAWHGLFLRAIVYEDAAAVEFVYSTGDALDPIVRVLQETTVP